MCTGSPIRRCLRALPDLKGIVCSTRLTRTAHMKAGVVLPLGGRGTRLPLPRLLPPCLEAHALPTPAPNNAWLGAEPPFLRTQVHSRSAAIQRVQWSIVVSLSSSSYARPVSRGRGGRLQTGGATAGARRRSRRAPPPRRSFTRQHPSRGRVRGCAVASPRAGSAQTADRCTAGRCVRLRCGEGQHREGNTSNLTTDDVCVLAPAAAATRAGRAGIRLSAKHGQGNGGGGGRGRVGVRACGQRGQRHLVGARAVLASALLLDRACTLLGHCCNPPPMRAHHPRLFPHRCSHRHTAPPLQSPSGCSSSADVGLPPTPSPTRPGVLRRVGRRASGRWP